MWRIASTLSPELAQLLERDLLRRSDIHLVAARSIEELVTAIRDGAELCLVETLLPDGDALDALDALRATPQGEHVPVVLVVPNDAAGSDIAGFSAQLALPAPAGAVEELLGRLLSAPRRRDLRRPASARVFDADGVAMGRLVDVASGGLALRTRRRFEPGERVTISLELPVQDHRLSVQVRVLRNAGEHVALALESPSAAIQEALSLLLSPPAAEGGLGFRPVPALGPRGAAIGGLLGEGPAHTALGAFFEGTSSEGPARLYLGDLLPFDDRGLDRWITLTRELGALELFGVPPWLRALADRVPATLSGETRIVSVALGLRCLECGDESEREAKLEKSSREVTRANAALLITAPCVICQGQLALADPLDSTFLFLAA